MAREGFAKKFDLDKSILGIDSSQTIEIATSTDMDVVDAIVNGKGFPTRPDGVIALGRINLEAEANKAVRFGQDDLKINFTALGGIKAGVGVYDDPGKAIETLDTEAPKGLSLKIDPKPDMRYVLMQWGWNATGKITGAHPIGTLGTLTFGAEARKEKLYAVLHGFDSKTTIAHRALTDTFNSWRLPRHLGRKPNLDDEILPTTWIITEAEGSVAVKVAAKLGYDLKIARDAELLGITRQLSAKVDAGIQATFGLHMSGRYLIVIGREANDPAAQVLRLRLFRQSKRGVDFGLNLSAGITNTTALPTNADDFVKGVLGIHGLQVIKDLHKVEQWTDPNKDLSHTAARLFRDTGLDLLRRATGIDPKLGKEKFDEARGVFNDLLNKWDALPERVAAETWRILEKLDDAGSQIFKEVLETFADPATLPAAVEKAVKEAAFGDTPAGQFLASTADLGLLALTNELESVQRTATQTLDVLNGGHLRQLQKFINEKLDVTKIKQVVNSVDFDNLNDWLVARLSDFLDEELGFAELQKLKNAIDAILSLRNKLYEQMKKAASARYGAQLALTYQRSATNAALLDVEFDLRDNKARQLFIDVVQNSNLDNVLRTPTPGVSLHQAMLSHQTRRSLTIDVHLPYWSHKQERITESLANLTVDGDVDRILVYQLSSKDTVTVANRFKSQLAVLASLRVTDGKFDPITGTISYELRQAQNNMKFADFEATVTPFITTFLPKLFVPPDGSVHNFLFDLDRTVENKVGNGPNEFGDILLAMQLAAPAQVLTAWFEERTDEQLKTDLMRVSRHLQVKLRHMLPFFYFQDLDHLFQNSSAAALLVWSALPVSTSVEIRDGQLIFNTDKDVFWNFPDIEMRRKMAADIHTAGALIPKLLSIQQRLREAGLTSRARDFDPHEASAFQSLTLSDIGAQLFASLLFTEAEIINGVADNLKKIQQFRSDLANAPSKAVPKLAEFGAKLTNTFNTRLGIYGGNGLRPLASMLLMETALALDGATEPDNQKALLSIAVLQEQRTFNLGDFVTGKNPEPQDIAVVQTLVS